MRREIVLCIIIDRHYLILLQNNTKRTKSVIQILNKGKHEILDIVTENVHAKKEHIFLKITKNKKSSKNIKAK